MSKQGAALQSYNNELVKYIEEMRLRHEDIKKLIDTDEKHKQDLENKIHQLKNELKKVDDSLAKKQKLSEEYERIIGTSEAAYQKILESSQTLLTVLKKESDSLQKETNT